MAAGVGGEGGAHQPATLQTALNCTYTGGDLPISNSFMRKLS